MAHDRPPVPDVSGSAWLFLANRAWEQSERGYSKSLSPTLPTCASLACTHHSCARFALARLGMLPSPYTPNVPTPERFQRRQRLVFGHMCSRIVDPLTERSTALVRLRHVGNLLSPTSDCKYCSVCNDDNCEGDALYNCANQGSINTKDGIIIVFNFDTKPSKTFPPFLTPKKPELYAPSHGKPLHRNTAHALKVEPLS